MGKNMNLQKKQLPAKTNSKVSNKNINIKIDKLKVNIHFNVNINFPGSK